MKITRKRGYISYGMYPTNEYTTSNDKADANPAVDPNETRRADGAIPVRSAESDLPALRLHYLLRPRKVGWFRTQSTSGWRAKAAAEQHENYHT